MKYLGVFIDSNLTFKKRVQAKCKTAMFNLRIKRIRHLLTEDARHTLVRGLILSHPDYCNAVYAGLPNTDSSASPEFSLKDCQNLRDIRQYNKNCTKSLVHWLPIRARI